MPKKAAEPIDLSVENLPKMTVVMLKNILESKNLPIAGKKADLIERLTTYLQESKGDEKGEGSKSPVKGNDDKPDSPLKTSISQPKLIASPAKEVPSDQGAKPGSPVKAAPLSSSKPVSPSKEAVPKPASPVKDTATNSASPAKPASPVKVAPSSPAKVPATKPESPKKPTSTEKEAPKSPVKTNGASSTSVPSPTKDAAKPKSPVKEHHKPASPQKDAAQRLPSPVKNAVDKPSSPVKEAMHKPAPMEPLETPHHHVSINPPASPKKDIHLHKRPTEEMPVSPSKKQKVDVEGSKNSSVHIQKFSRPLNVESLKQKLDQISPLIDFWMDKIRSNCYARFASEDEARKVHEAMDKLEFQAGNILEAKIVSNSDAEADMRGQEASSAVSVVPPPEFLKTERRSEDHDRRDSGGPAERYRDRNHDRRDNRDRDRDFRNRHQDRRDDRGRDRDRVYGNRDYNRGDRGRDFNNRDRFDRDRYDNRDRPRGRDFYRGRGGSRGRDSHNRDRFDRDRFDNRDRDRNGDRSRSNDHTRDRFDRDRPDDRERDRIDDRPKNEPERAA